MKTERLNLIHFNIVALLWVGYKFKLAKQLLIKYLLYSKYRYFIESYSYVEKVEEEDDQSLYPIWVCWWQGEENMPGIVKVCYKSVLENANGHPVNLITMENYRDYVTFPDHILEKFNKGLISMTHLSDILRVSLIYEYGGMWIDATILLTRPLPKKISGDVFSIKHKKKKPHVTHYRWTAFFWYGKKGNILFHYAQSFFYEYWKKETTMINYLLIDYVFAIAYDRIPAITNLVDSIPFNNPHHNDIRYQFKANGTFDLSLYNTICSDTYLHKLSWKMIPQKYVEDGGLTFYGFLVKRLPIEYQ